jgi:hypothetical protein
MITTEKSNGLFLPDRRLGKAPAKAGPRALLFANYVAPIVIPKATEFWHKRTKFPLESYGNKEYGCCTIASQALFTMKMERLEQRRTIDIADEEVIRVYLAMTARLYGGGDSGAFEEDALDNWRKPDLSFRDSKGRPYTIDAYTKINHTNIMEIKKAIYTSGGHGIKLCFNLPWAWSSTYRWDAPDNGILTGDWVPGSWGGHSMCSAFDYDENGIWVDHTWEVEPGYVTNAGLAAYCDEAHMVIDSVNNWKKKSSLLDIPSLVSDVNMVSSQKIKL